MDTQPVLKLLVVIINYRTPEMIKDCLASLLPDLSSVSGKAVVVDNNSGDDSPAQIQKWIDDHDTDNRIKLINSKVNTGFSGGNNTGIGYQKAKFYLLLNSDTFVRPNTLQKLLKTAEEHPEHGLYSPLLESPDEQGQQSTFRFHRPITEFMTAAQTGIIDQLFHRYQVALPVQKANISPEWTSFACIMIRAEVFETAGMLDEKFFMYYEDIEFCARAAEHGWTVLHCPEARVVHLRGGSSPVKTCLRLRKRLPRYLYESRTRYFYLRFGRSGPLMANLFWMAGRLISFVRQLAGRADKSVPERQAMDIWINCLHPTREYTHPDTEAREAHD